MSIPSKFRLLGKNYAITQISEEENAGNRGFVTFHKTDIRIWNSMVYDCKCEIILHEILHTISDELRLKLNETQVHNLGVALNHLLADNPQIRRMYENETEKRSGPTLLG